MVRSFIASIAVASFGLFAFGACAGGTITEKTLGAGGDVGVGGNGTSSSGAGGAASSTTTSSSSSSSTTSSSSSSGVPGTCVMKADCAGFDDACNSGNCVNGMCVKTPANDGSQCDDGLFCTDNDACSGGICVGGTAKFCPSPDSCHVGACDEAKKACGSAPGNDGASCDDGDPCTYSGTCASGACSKGSPVDCSAFNGTCADGVCDPVLGCQAKPKNDGAACDDGLYCTVNDVCKAGACSGAPNTCAPPGNICMVGMCNEAQKTCVAVPGNNGMACNDGNACHVNAACSNGMCTGGVPGNAGAMCDDGNGCTTGTTCTNGVCGNATTTISQCIVGDKCCPPGCSPAMDADCVPNYCATFKWAPGTTGIVMAPAPFTCPTNATQWCDSTPISPTNAAQAAKACEVCYGVPCVLSNGDCAGPGYSKIADTGPTFGYQGAGCSSEPAGRVWQYGSSYAYYGTWAP